MIWVNVMESQGQKLLAACDEELLGKTFSEGELELEVKEDFYGGEKIPEESLAGKFEGANVINLVGEKCVQCGIDAGIITPENVLKIQGIPHAQYFKL
jgi:hypothetical protein